MRVVFDPNVLVSAAIAPGGVTGRLVRAALAGRFTVVACPHLLGELQGVLGRPKFRRHLTLSQAEEFVVAIEGVAEASPDPEVEPVTRDPYDDYLVALATAAGVDHLVSGDSDLLELVDPPVSILSPREFADGLGTSW